MNTMRYPHQTRYSTTSHNDNKKSPISLAFCPSSYSNNNVLSHYNSIRQYKPATNSINNPILTPCSTRGQFAKRLRPSTILNGDGHLSRNSSTSSPTTSPHYTPSSSPSAPPIFTTPTASLIASISSLASTGAGIFILGFIVFIHESGHFLAARLQGIRVKTFSIGFGPTIWSFKPDNSETEFTVRLLPLGGYVAFPEHMKLANSDDESNEGQLTAQTESNDNDTKEEGTEDKQDEYIMDEDPNLLQNRPVLDRAIVVSAGVIANVALAWFAIFSSVSTVGIPKYNVQPGAIVASLVDPSGPAARDGLLASDIILSLNGESVPVSLDSASIVAEKIRSSKGQPLNFSVLRQSPTTLDNETVNITVKPKCCLPDGSSSVGVQLVPNAKITRVKPTSPIQTISLTNSEFTRLFKQTWRGLSSLVKNFKTSSQNLSGPIGVVSIGADLARNDTSALFTFCAVISINLALINSLPLPALDGGQMTFLIIEALRGVPVSLKVQDTVNRTALVLLLAFSGVLFLGDLERLNVVGALQKLFG